MLVITKSPIYNQFKILSTCGWCCCSLGSLLLFANAYSNFILTQDNRSKCVKYKLKSLWFLPWPWLLQLLFELNGMQHANCTEWQCVGASKYARKMFVCVCMCVLFFFIHFRNEPIPSSRQIDTLTEFHMWHIVENFVVVRTHANRCPSFGGGNVYDKCLSTKYTR